MKYGIAIFPSKEIQDRANNLRKRYDSHYRTIPPHITIKETFELEEDLEQTINHLEEVTKKIPPFQLKVNKIKTFMPTSPVIYFALDDDELVVDLHDKVNSGILHHDMKFKYIPHITIAQDLSSQEIYDVYGRLKLKDFELAFDVDRIHLLFQNEDQQWINHQTFLLRGEK